MKCRASTFKGKSTATYGAGRWVRSLTPKLATRLLLTWDRVKSAVTAWTPPAVETEATDLTGQPRTYSEGANTQGLYSNTQGASYEAPNEVPTRLAPRVRIEEPTDLGSACGLGGVQGDNRNHSERSLVDSEERRIEIRGQVHARGVGVPAVDRSLAIRELADGWFWQYAGGRFGPAVSEREAFTEALLHIGVEANVYPLTRPDELEFALAQSIKAAKEKHS